MIKSIVFLVGLSAVSASLTKLASFDGAKGTTFKWSDMKCVQCLLSMCDALVAVILTHIASFVAPRTHPATQ